MYSRKSAGPWIEAAGTPALTGYSCKYLSSRTTWAAYYWRKEEDHVKK